MTGRRRNGVRHPNTPLRKHEDKTVSERLNQDPGTFSFSPRHPIHSHYAIQYVGSRRIGFGLRANYGYWLHLLPTLIMVVIGIYLIVRSRDVATFLFKDEDE